MFKSLPKRFVNGAVGVLVLGLVALDMYNGEVSAGRYSSDTWSSDNPFFWLKIAFMSGVGFFLLFGALFEWDFFSDAAGPDDEPDFLDPTPSTPEPDTADVASSEPPSSDIPEADTAASGEEPGEDSEILW